MSEVKSPAGLFILSDVVSYETYTKTIVANNYNCKCGLTSNTPVSNARDIN